MQIQLIPLHNVYRQQLSLCMMCTAFVARKKAILFVICLTSFLCLWNTQFVALPQYEVNNTVIDDTPLIILVTATRKGPRRIADMTRLSQTLMHVQKLKWIVIEDGNHTADTMERLLQRSGIDYVYINSETPIKIPVKGWAQRNAGLTYLREMYTGDHEPAVVYFADDDNSYDLRLFNEYIRQVKSVGFWAVGFAGAAKVEAPRVEDSKLVGWDVIYARDRKYATDMAGFAVALDLILQSNATFHRLCAIPETCFLEQLPINPNNIQIFGWDRVPRDLVVWHTRTSPGGLRGESYGYVFED